MTDLESMTGEMQDSVQDSASEVIRSVENLPPHMNDRDVR
jgi:hypothetical protein